MSKPKVELQTSLVRAAEQYLIDQHLLTKDKTPTPELICAVKNLSDLFTKERADIKSGYINDSLTRGAYIAGFLLTNFAKIIHCIDEVRSIFQDKDEISILDAGCGPGTATLAASFWFRGKEDDRKVSFTAFDSNRRILEDAEKLAVSILGKNHNVTWHVGDLRKIPDIDEYFPSPLSGRGLERGAVSRFDLAIAANSLNELKSFDEKLAACVRLLEISDVVIVTDPALKATARELMRLRDALIERGDVQIIAPCTHLSSCPMLSANERDWCHFYCEWKRPGLIEALDRSTGLDHRYLKLSYLVLRNSCSVSGSRLPVSGWRVVSAPLNSKGKTELHLCGGNGELRRVRRLDKHASQSNEDFGTAMRGDLVKWRGEEDRVLADEEFKIIKKFNNF